MKHILHSPGGKPTRIALVAALVLTSGLFLSARADDDGESSGAKFSAEAAVTFNKRCTACHTYGKGIKVGPDLKGVNDRRKRDWLLKFIHESSKVIKSGDPTATELFAQFKQQRMPDWTDLSEKQITDILDYVAVGGPDIKPADERNAELATPSEIETGRQLFHGNARLKYGAQSCSACHAVQGEGWGGSLGPNLTQTYFKYQDRALTEFLRHPCFRWDAGGPGEHYLTLKESFALKAFLRAVAVRQQQSAGAGKTATTVQAAPLPAKENRAALAPQSGTQKGSPR